MKRNVYCDVMTPESFTTIAALAQARQVKIRPAGSVEGDNAAAPRKKAKKKRSKRK